MGPVLGIDLGTTYCSMAVVNEYGRADVLPNREGERTTPSVVLFDADRPVVGTFAKQAALADPLNVCQFVKRQMGVKSWKFRTESGSVYTAEEVSAFLLKRMKEDAEASLGVAVDDAVITVPAYFNDAQRKATQDAGAIAGLNVRRIINEPTAAALAYGLKGLSLEETVLVYDLGGGTFDVTVMRILENSVEVLATGGDKNLGGFDWDNELIRFLARGIMERGGPDLTDVPQSLQDLRDKAEAAKRTLSVRAKVNVFLSAPGQNFNLEVTREDFEEITKQLLNRTRTICRMVVDDAGLAWESIDKILLVGGSTRMPAVAKMLESLAGKPPSQEVHPDEAVAVGAAIQGAILDSDQRGDDKTLLLTVSDVTSHSLGVLALDRDEKLYNSIILPKNSKIPTSASSEYVTVVDNQKEINLQVVQGEDRDPDYVTIMVETKISLPPYKEGAPIKVSFDYDSDGMIQVEVFDQTAGSILRNIELVRPSNHGDQQVARMREKVRAITIE